MVSFLSRQLFLSRRYTPWTIARSATSSTDEPIFNPNVVQKIALRVNGIAESEEASFSEKFAWGTARERGVKNQKTESSCDSPLLHPLIECRTWLSHLALTPISRLRGRGVRGWIGFRVVMHEVAS